MKRLCLVALLAPCLFANGQNLPAGIPANGVVAWFPFSGTASDNSGNGNTAKVNGATSTYDRFGRPNAAVRFDGVSSFISVNLKSPVALGSDFTICAWFSTKDPDQAMQTIIGKGRSKDGSALNLGYGQSGEDKTSAYFGLQGIHPMVVLSTPTISTGQGWHSIMAIYSGMYMDIFLDGVFCKATTLSKDEAAEIAKNMAAAEPLEIGRETSGLGRYFNGDIDDILIYNRAIQGGEIEKIYNVSKNEADLYAFSDSYRPSSQLYVATLAGLSLRKTADLKGAVITVLPFGTELTVMEDPAPRVPLTNSNISGTWVKVTDGSRSGYVFDGFLSRYKFPSGDGPEHMISFLKNQFTILRETTRPPDARQYNMYHNIALHCGARFAWEAPEGGSSIVTTFPVYMISFQEVYLLARIIYPDLFAKCPYVEGKMQCGEDPGVSIELQKNFMYSISYGKSD